jgi:hypothetical protein
MIASAALVAQAATGLAQQTASDSQRYRVQVPCRLIVISGSPDVSNWR